MSEVFKINLTSDVINHFEKVLSEEVIIDERKIFNQVKHAIAKLKSADPVSFVIKHIAQLEEMVTMLKDRRWNMSAEDKQSVLAALSYFVDENDLIPDDIPVVGLLDDCIIIDLVSDKIIHELEAYREFNHAIKIYGKSDDFKVSDWIELKRKELFSRMRSRRNKSRSSYRTRGTSFTL